MNFEALLAAISEASPCGDDLSFSAEFDAIQELRRADDPTLAQGEWVTALKSSDWSGVSALCEDVLKRRGKDLRVAAWLTEANARLQGYAGLADGLALCGFLCERHWDGLYPRLEDDGDAEQRAGALRWLLAQVEALAPQLVVPCHGERAGQSTAAAGRPTPDEVAADLAAAQRARQALARLEQLIDARLGADGPGFARARQALDDALHAVEHLARDAGPPAVAPAADAGVAEAGEARAGDAALSDGMPRTRAEALRQLRAVADFFRRTEPHSPVAYLAERAAKWGDMPLHAWLRAVVKDAGTLSHMEELLGVEPPSPPAD